MTDIGSPNIDYFLEKCDDMFLKVVKHRTMSFLSFCVIDKVFFGLGQGFSDLGFLLIFHSIDVERG